MTIASTIADGRDPMTDGSKDEDDPFHFQSAQSPFERADALTQQQLGPAPLADPNDPSKFKRYISISTEYTRNNLRAIQGATARSADQRFEAVQIDDFNAIEFPDHLWHIENVVPSQGVGLIGASNKSGKSLFCIQLGLCLAAGIPWWGRTVARPISTLYIEEEGALKAIQERTVRIKAALGIGPGVRFYVAARRKARLDTPEGIAELRALIVLHGAEVVFIGPFAAVAHVADENGAADIGPIMSELNDIATDLDTTVYLVHHARKATGNGMRRPGSVLEFFQTIRGSGAFVDRIDIGLGLWRSPKEAAGTLYVLSRDGDDFMKNFVYDHATRTTAPTEALTAEQKAESEVDRLIRIAVENGPLGIEDFLRLSEFKSRTTIDRKLAALVTSGFLLMEPGARNKHIYRASARGVGRITEEIFNDD
jgi:hypothetical protein